MELDNELSYLAGVISGDGHIKKGIKHIGKDYSKDYGIMIYSNNNSFLEYVLLLIKRKVKTITTIKPGKRSYYISIRNKELHNVLSNIIGIPTGKKSDIIKIPKIIKNNKEYLKHFIAGFFDTDGGFKGNSIGFCSASNQIIDELITYLIRFKINSSKDKWINKKYNKEYYALKIRKVDIAKFIETIPLKNKEKLDKIQNKFRQECRSGQTGWV